MPKIKKPTKRFSKIQTNPLIGRTGKRFWRSRRSLLEVRDALK
jgi:hypothetical protein